MQPSRAETAALRRKVHQSIRKATQDIESLSFNTYIANAMDQIKRVILYQFQSTVKDPAQLNTLTKKLNDIFHTQQITGDWNKLTQEVGTIHDLLWSKNGFMDGLKRLPEEELPEHLETIWRTLGLDADIPSGPYDKAGRLEIKDFVWRLWGAKRDTDFMANRNKLVIDFYDMLDNLPQLVGVPKTYVDKVIKNLAYVDSVKINASRNFVY